jgi:prepilin-type N-terminal cleavage/methylation domain-containing protein
MKLRGFTVVELLIVIVIIGILASIVLANYNGIQKSARISSMQSDMNSVIKQLEIFKTSSITDSYPTSLSAGNIKQNSDLVYAYISSNSSSYCLSSTTDGTSYFITPNNRQFQLGDCNVTSGLVGQWKLNNDANDSSGNVWTSTATSTQAAVGQNGQANSAYAFDGTSSQIDTNHVFALDTFTFTIWVYPTASGGYRAPLSEARDCCSTGYHGFDFHTSYTANNAGFQLWNAAGTATGGVGGANTDLNTWNFFAGSFDGSNTKLYKNGQLINTTTSYSGLLGTPTSTLKIGRTGNVTAGFFIGYIDEARLYNRALSLNEIQAVYAGGAQ